MAENGTPRRASLVFPIVLITVGAIVLYSNWRPSFDPWPILWTYWPLILIFVGAGKIWDSWQRRQNPDSRTSGSGMGASLGAVAFVVVLVALLWHGKRFNHWRGGTVYAMPASDLAHSRSSECQVRPGHFGYGCRRT